MTIQEACSILGVKAEDDKKTIKLQFRKLISKYHPDAVGSDSPEHLKKAQLLNEAYALLRKKIANSESQAVKKPVWKGTLKEDAFTERTIYMAGISWEGEKPEEYMVARGRYEWDPNLEEFECMLKSINEAVIELLEKIEHQNELYRIYDQSIKAQRFDYQLQLFHLLASQFISPVFCLKKLAEPENTDEQGREIYKLQAFLGTKGMGKIFSAMARLKTGELLYATSLKNNRITVSNAAGETLGYLSLAEDSLYYVVIPILQKHMAQVKLMVSEIAIYPNSRPKQIKVNVDLYLRMGKLEEKMTCSDHNLRIAAVLNSYDAYLKRVMK